MLRVNLATIKLRHGIQPYAVVFSHGHFCIFVFQKKTRPLLVWGIITLERCSYVSKPSWNWRKKTGQNHHPQPSPWELTSGKPCFNNWSLTTTWRDLLFLLPRGACRFLGKNQLPRDTSAKVTRNLPVSMFCNSCAANLNCLSWNSEIFGVFFWGDACASIMPSRSSWCDQWFITLLLRGCYSTDKWLKLLHPAFYHVLHSIILKMVVSNRNLLLQKGPGPHLRYLWWIKLWIVGKNMALDSAWWWIFGGVDVKRLKMNLPMII